MILATKYARRLQPSFQPNDSDTRGKTCRASNVARCHGRGRITFDELAGDVSKEVVASRVDEFPEKVCSLAWRIDRGGRSEGEVLNDATCLATKRELHSEFVSKSIAKSFCSGRRIACRIQTGQRMWLVSSQGHKNVRISQTNSRRSIILWVCRFRIWLRILHDRVPSHPRTCLQPPDHRESVL